LLVLGTNRLTEGVPIPEWVGPTGNQVSNCDNQPKRASFGCGGNRQAEFQTGAAIWLANATDVTFDRVTMRHHGQQAFWLVDGCNNVSFVRGNISDLGTGAVRVGLASPSRHQGSSGLLPVNTSHLWVATFLGGRLIAGSSAHFCLFGALPSRLSCH
jgi:hypothetical protein